MLTLSKFISTRLLYGLFSYTSHVIKKMKKMKIMMVIDQFGEQIFNIHITCISCIIFLTFIFDSCCYPIALEYPLERKFKTKPFT